MILLEKSFLQHYFFAMVQTASGRVQGAGLKSGATVPVVMVPFVFSC